jgi:hypothetical protein
MLTTSSGLRIGGTRRSRPVIPHLAETILDFIGEVDKSNDQNDIVIQAAAAAAGRYASGGYMTVYDGVVGPWFLPTFAIATGLVCLDYLVLLPSLLPASPRTRSRV